MSEQSSSGSVKALHDALNEARRDAKHLARELQQGLPKRNAAEQLEAMASAIDDILSMRLAVAQASAPEPVAWRWRFNDEPDNRWDLRAKKPKFADDRDVICEPLYTLSSLPSTNQGSAAAPTCGTPSIGLRTGDDTYSRFTANREDTERKTLSNPSSQPSSNRDTDA
jgi:hypothetical protein